MKIKIYHHCGSLDSEFKLLPSETPEIVELLNFEPSKSIDKVEPCVPIVTPLPCCALLNFLS